MSDAPLPLLALALLAALLLTAAWHRHRRYRLAERPDRESALNQPASDWLRQSGDFDRVKLDAEVPRETVYLPGWRARWLLVTNRRVLLFAASGSERRLQSEWPRRAVVFAGPPGASGAAWLRLLRPAPNLALTFTTGTTLHLRCASSVTARRVAQLLMSSPALPEESFQAPAHFTVARRGR